MTEIGRVNKHKTTHQDGGDDELVLTGILPGVHKTTHQDAGADEIDATGLAGRCNFVDRGDPTAVDFNASSLTVGGAWADLDLSGIVPAGTIAVVMKVLLVDDAVASEINLRKKGNTNEVNVSTLCTQSAGIPAALDVIVYVDANRVVQYYRSNVVFTIITITIKGYFI